MECNIFWGISRTGRVFNYVYSTSESGIAGRAGRAGRAGNAGKAGKAGMVMIDLKGFCTFLQE